MQPCFLIVDIHTCCYLRPPGDPTSNPRPYQQPQTLTMAPAARRSVQAAGAAGVLVGSPSDSRVVQMDCSGAECDRELAIPAAMIPAAAADALQVQQMLKQGDTVHAPYCLLPSCLHVCSEAWLCGLCGEHRRPDIPCFHATARVSTQTEAPAHTLPGPMRPLRAPLKAVPGVSSASRRGGSRLPWTRSASRARRGLGGSSRRSAAMRPSTAKAACSRRASSRSSAPGRAY